MARPLRFEYPGAVYHVMARGDGGKAVFEEDRDRRDFHRSARDHLRRARVEDSLVGADGEQEAVLKRLEALAASEGISLTEDVLIIIF